MTERKEQIMAAKKQITSDITSFAAAVQAALAKEAEQPDESEDN